MSIFHGVDLFRLSAVATAVLCLTNCGGGDSEATLGQSTSGPSGQSRAVAGSGPSTAQTGTGAKAAGCGDRRRIGR